LVSHDLGFVSDYADRVVCVKRTVAVHETCALSNDIMRELYGRSVRMVRHNNKCDGHGDRRDEHGSGHDA
ncbi:ABC transporter, partial [bacterium]|nr:ABC transporter [bacterium]